MSGIEALIRLEKVRSPIESASRLQESRVLRREGAENSQVALLLHFRSVAGLFARVRENSQSHVPICVSVLQLHLTIKYLDF